MIKHLLLALVLGSVVISVNAQSLNIDNNLKYCNSQVNRALQKLQRADGSFDFTLEPRNILKEDKQRGWNCRPAKAEEWCSGFWPGILWMDYAYTKDQHIQQAAEGYSSSLESLAYRPAYDHDLGFIMIGSMLKGYEQTHAQKYRQTLLAAADTLATLYSPKVGTILSWPRHVKDYGGHNTIMDNMINLELLFWASAHGGSPYLKDIAISHATTTMRHQFRPDGSCYHVAIYDTLSGDFIKGVTHQGYSDSSMWARGQSWAIYGYTMVYRWTHDKVFLQFAQKVTDIYLKRLKETSDDLIPLWDMDDPSGLQAPKDASAAAVVADALLELQGYLGGDKGAEYKEIAEKTLVQLSSSKYQSRDHNVAFLLHSTGHHPAGTEIDASIVYADYYYLEALLRARALQ